MREAMSSGAAEGEEPSSSAAFAHFLRSRLAHHEGDHRRALDELRLALASDDGNPFLLTALAEEHARLSDLDRAERELRRVIERHPDYHPAQLLMGRVLYEAQKVTRAKVHLARAIKLKPKDPDAYLVLTQLWLEQAKPDQAIRVVEELSAAVPGEPIGYKRLGLALAERGDPLRAEKLLRRAVARDPGDFEVWHSLAQLYEASDRLTEAAEAYDKALERDPEHREVLLAAGRLALRTGQLPKAKAYFDQLMGVSEDPELAVKVAFSYLATRQLGEAAEVLDRARSRASGEPRLHFYAGLMREKLGEHSKAAEAYAAVPPGAGELFHEARLHRAQSLSTAGQPKVALDLLRAGLADRPDYLPLYSAYARALERAGQPKEGEAFLRRSLEKRPAPELFEALSSLYERQGRLAEAIDLLTDALRRQPKDEVLLYTLGAAYERKGDIARSLEKMRAVLDVNPKNANAMNFIGYTLAQRGLDFDEAERMLVRALELNPDNGAYLDSLGWVYFRKGEIQRAMETLERALSLTPGEPTILEHLGDVYSRLSRKAQALELYRQALDALIASPELAEHKGQRSALERKLKALSTELPGR
ncbi:MAG: tetratricopeptide repeat protein [Myxococcales bacterium]|nr:tetratricopeptide repeat protein [Myxococcales bacterium]